MELKDVYLWLKSIRGISNKTIQKIENEVGNIKKLFDFSDKEIYHLKNINLNIKQNIVKYKSHSYLDNIKEKLHKENINYICIHDEKYPNNLKNIYDAPSILYYKGNVNIINNGLNLAMVGSRKPTRYGISCAKTISNQLSEMGINIVSGLAIGIDSYSHVGCLNGVGKTIAVLGSSVHNPLPKQNIYLSNEILENDGVLISEYGVDSYVIPSNFSNRNRIISGISEGVIVVEAAKKSGALITVEFALDQGKNVFAIPGNINSDMSKGCHKIIKEGAKLVENIEDIIDEYNINSIKDKNIGKNYANISLNEDCIKIINLIKHKGCLQIDEICDYIGMEIKYVNTILNELELYDLVIETNNKTYSLNI
ncbi:DNA-protecting protein DprA [Romboutsia maritimum]|uniref:DNA-protecting protein DprA n=1 Tax=Romboutsia maritimum TaxID=2020948 RepID=A0A371IWD3_9FIRM|nr:DNA-processing protein DprA [Romboutsia maritimum]RDY24791.1 DNA-protecting protein DprA [Romboutsia maritimum]